MPPNQPFTVPRMPFNATNPPMSRSDIMGTGVNPAPFTMFMPGQSLGSPTEYPTAWPEAGTMLRVPKCVFLTSNPPAHLWGKNFTLMSKWSPYGYFGHWYDMHVRDTRYEAATVGSEGSEIFGGFTGNYGYIGWTIDPQYSSTNDGRRK